MWNTEIVQRTRIIFAVCGKIQEQKIFQSAILFVKSSPRWWLLVVNSGRPIPSWYECHSDYRGSAWPSGVQYPMAKHEQSMVARMHKEGALFKFWRSMQCHRQDRHFQTGTLYTRPKIFNSAPADHGKKYEGKALQGNSLKTGKSVEQNVIQASLAMPHTWDANLMEWYVRMEKWRWSAPTLHGILSASTLHCIVQLSSFRQLWRQLLPFIVAGKPMSDLGWVCQHNNQHIRRAVNIPEEAKSEALRLQEAHLLHATAEYSFYQKLWCANSRDVVGSKVNCISGSSNHTSPSAPWPNSWARRNDCWVVELSIVKNH